MFILGSLGMRIEGMTHNLSMLASVKFGYCSFYEVTDEFVPKCCGIEVNIKDTFPTFYMLISLFIFISKLLYAQVYC